MVWLWGSLAVLAVLALGWLFCLMPRRGERRLERLRRFRYTHRGLHNLPRGVPENSMLAFRYAVTGGFGIELDVRLSRDRVPVVIHDGSLRRLCGVEGFVEKTSVEELQKLKLLGTRESVPTLEEVLQLVDGKVPLMLELKSYKNNVRDLCLKTAKLLEGYRGDFAVESFDPRVLRWMRRNEPFVIRGQLLETRKDSEGTKKYGVLARLPALLLTNVFTRPDFFACPFQNRRGMCLRFCIDALKGQEVCWTIQSQQELEEAENGGAMVIFEGFLPKKAAEEQEEKASA